MLTKRQALDLFNGSAQDLQAALGLKSRTAIIMWGGDDAEIPERHDLRIRYVLKPECFNADGSLRKQPVRKKAA